MNDNVELIAEINQWYAVCSDGVLRVLGDHGDIETAYETVEDTDLDAVWVLHQETALEWYHQIGFRIRNRLPGLWYALDKTGSLNDLCNCYDFDAAEAKAEEKGISPIWTLSHEDAVDWRNTIRFGTFEAVNAMAAIESRWG